MKKILLILVVFFTTFNYSFAINDLKKVECDSSFSSECGECSEIIMPKSGIIEKLDFFHYSNDREILYKEEQVVPYLTDGFGKKITAIKGFNYPQNFSNLFIDEEEGYLFNKNIEKSILILENKINILDILPKNTNNGKILGFINHKIYTHLFNENREVYPNPIERTQCIKLIDNFNKESLLKYKIIDKKINSFFLKNKYKLTEDKIVIYTKFIGKLNKILEIQKYSKYFDIIKYMKKKILIELKNEINNF